jgi:hypothetical protein
MLLYGGGGGGDNDDDDDDYAHSSFFLTQYTVFIAYVLLCFSLVFKLAYLEHLYLTQYISVVVLLH